MQFKSKDSLSWVQQYIFSFVGVVGIYYLPIGGSYLHYIDEQLI